jgi:hypothetical protein
MKATKQARGVERKELLQQQNIKPAKNPKTKKHESASLPSFLFIQVSFFSVHPSLILLHHSC